jgi:hypothetical protein
MREFTHKGYARMLEYLSTRYALIPFQDFHKTSEPKVILRHDLDAWLSSAIPMAEIEKGLGIRATYFVLLSSRFYNVFEDGSFRILKQLVGMGHEIGLHYDAVQYADYGRPARMMLRHGIDCLESLTGKTVGTISRHNVSETDGDPFAGSTEPLNAYNDEFLKDALYISDSCRRWSPGRVRQMLTGKPPVVQLLIHPGLWHHSACSVDELLDARHEELEKEQREYTGYWRSRWKVKEKSD